MIKRALIVGINYVGTREELRGCINDAANIHRLVTEKLGFTETKMVLEQEATTQGILDGLNWLTTGVQPGDVILFHYSGHGSQIRSRLEPDGLDEILCPIDLNWRDRVIRDDHIKEIFNKVPNGVNVTVILDCCHSGSGLDQNQSLFKTPRELIEAFNAEKPESKNRFLPMPEEVQTEIEKEGLALREFKTSRDVNRTALLIAGCMPYQTSADALINGQFQGAATYSLISALNNNLTTYKDIAEYMDAFMRRVGFEQRPQLDGHPSLYEEKFLQPWGTGFEMSKEPLEQFAPSEDHGGASGDLVRPPRPPASGPTPESNSNKVLWGIIVITLCAAAYLIFGR